MLHLFFLVCIMTVYCQVQNVEHVGPWKMTIASSNPSVAGQFVVKHFNGEVVTAYSIKPTDHENNVCVDLAWVAFPEYTYEGIGDRIPYNFQTEPFHQFQLHFVKHYHRYEGAMSISAYESHLERLHANFTLYHVFMDNRVVMEALDLDPICVSLANDHVPFFVRLNKDDTSSLFVQVPHGGMFEIVSRKLSVVKAKPWNRCESNAISPAVVESVAVLSSEYARPQLRPLRFVYAASHAAASASFFAENTGGKLKLHSSGENIEAGEGSCFCSYTVEFETMLTSAPFELQWVTWEDEAQSALRREMETYLSDIHGNFSLRSGNLWNHYIDNHAGLHVTDCGSITRRFDEAGIPYFYAKQLQIFGLYFTDSNGIAYEFICHDDSSRCAMDVEDWDWCVELEEPAVYGAPVKRVDGREDLSDRPYSTIHGEIIPGSGVVCRQSTVLSDDATVYWNEGMAFGWEYNVRFPAYLEVLYKSDPDILESVIRGNIHRGQDLLVEISASQAEGTLPYRYMNLLRLHFADLKFLRPARRRHYDNTWALSMASERSVVDVVGGRLTQMARGNTMFNEMLAAIWTLKVLLRKLCGVHSVGGVDFTLMTVDAVYRHIAEQSLTVLSNRFLLQYVNDTLIELLRREDSCGQRAALVNSPAEILTIEDLDLSSTTGGSSTLRVMETSGWDVNEMFEEFQSAGSASEAVGEEDPSVRLRALVMSQVQNGTILNVTMSLVIVRCSSGPLVVEVKADGGGDDISTSVEVSVQPCESIPGLFVGTYNTVLATNAMMLSPLVLNTTAGAVPGPVRAMSLPVGPVELRGAMCSMPPQCHLNNARTPEALILGLGGAELHSLLVKHHRCMRITSIEISVDVLRTAVSHFGLPVCAVSDPEGHDIHVSGVVECSVDPVVNKAACRSRVQIGDAWLALQTLHAKGALFDFVVSDLYDLHVTEWDGHIGTGQSNPNGLVDIVGRIKRVLHPDTGVAIMHIHKDSFFQLVLDAIKEQFYDVVIFQVNSNSNILVASMNNPLRYRSRFDPEAQEVQQDMARSSNCRPCDDMVKMAQAVSNYIEYVGYSKFAELTRFSLRCDL